MLWNKYYCVVSDDVGVLLLSIFCCVLLVDRFSISRIWRKERRKVDLIGGAVIR